jgi:flagellar motor switch protein FliM
MQNELNQAEIDAMVRAARTGAATAPVAAREPSVELWDPLRAGQIGREQLRAITLLHEGFARSLSHALASYLRAVFTATLVSAEHLAYREFLQRIPETTYLAACKLEPMGVSGALQLDLKVIFPILDLLLGGEGKGIAANREITEIEEQIVESVARIVCRELGTAWQAVNLEVGYERRIELAEAQRLLLPDEKVLSLSFEAAILDVRGGLNFAIPVVVSHALLRKMSAEQSGRRPHGRSDWRGQLQRRLLECPFPLQLEVNELRAPVSELSQLHIGQLLPFQRSAAAPASLWVAGVEMFRAMPAQRAGTLAAQLIAAVEPAVEKGIDSPLHGEKNLNKNDDTGAKR